MVGDPSLGEEPPDVLEAGVAEFDRRTPNTEPGPHARRVEHLVEVPESVLDPPELPADRSRRGQGAGRSLRSPRSQLPA